MNVYDFDKTIFRGDSTRRFLLFLLVKRPRLFLRVPAFLINALLFSLRLRGKQEFKQRMFAAFFGHAGNIEPLLNEFWDKNACRVKKWYAHTRREDDIIITASPEALVRAGCQRMGIKNVMGSPVDLRTGLYTGRNCHGEEKVRRLYAAYPGAVVEDFYSDSHSDDPLAGIAGRAFLVKGERLLDWRDA